jgi:hypothetical protein
VAAPWGLLPRAGAAQARVSGRGAGQGRTQLGRAQDRRGKAEASAGPAAGGGVAARAMACRAMACRMMACRATACSAWRCPRWVSSGRDWVGVQGCRRGAGGAAVRHLLADPHGSSGAARGGRRRPLRRRQRTRSGGTASCSWRTRRWPGMGGSGRRGPGAGRPWPSRRQKGRVWRSELGRRSYAAARGGRAHRALSRRWLSAAVQPGMTSSLHPCGGRGRSNEAQVRRAAQDRWRW